VDNLGVSSILEESSYYERLAMEAQELQNEEPSFKPVNDDLTKWQGFILGTGLYESGVFHIEIDLNRRYPFEPPKVNFITRIWHPNISLSGRVCVGILGKDWTPSLNLVGVIETIRNLLNYPNPNDPLNRDAAKEMKEKPWQFEKNAKDYLKKYATSWDQ
jgi:ubiquitin-conjugating enzyme E2 D/E